MLLFQWLLSKMGLIFKTKSYETVHFTFLRSGWTHWKNLVHQRNIMYAHLHKKRKMPYLSLFHSLYQNLHEDLEIPCSHNANFIGWHIHFIIDDKLNIFPLLFPWQPVKSYPRRGQIWRFYLVCHFLTIPCHFITTISVILRIKIWS